MSKLENKIFSVVAEVFRDKGLCPFPDYVKMTNSLSKGGFINCGGFAGYSRHPKFKSPDEAHFYYIQCAEHEKIELIIFSDSSVVIKGIKSSSVTPIIPRWINTKDSLPKVSRRYTSARGETFKEENKVLLHDGNNNTLVAILSQWDEKEEAKWVDCSSGNSYSNEVPLHWMELPCTDGLLELPTKEVA